jgi:mannose-6-phosphate isomerase-like protein (cupin superfamily)
MSLQNPIIPYADGRPKPGEPVPSPSDIPAEAIDEAVAQIVQENGKKEPNGPCLALDGVAAEVIDKALGQIVQKNEGKTHGAWIFRWWAILAYIMHFGDWPACSYVKARRGLSPPGHQGVWSSFVSVFGAAARQSYHMHMYQSEIFIVLRGMLVLWIEEGGKPVRHVLHELDWCVVPQKTFHLSEVFKGRDGEEPAVLVIKSPCIHTDVPGYKLEKPFPAN